VAISNRRAVVEVWASEEGGSMARMVRESRVEVRDRLFLR
jgi:hypothetical protein